MNETGCTHIGRMSPMHSMPEPREPDVLSALSMLRENTTALDKILEELARRLGPILGPERPVADPCKGTSERESSCDVSKAIRIEARRLDGMYYSVEALIAQVEV